MAAVKGRPPREFVVDPSANIAADFDLWLEDFEDYLDIAKVADAGEKKKLLLNLAGLSLRRIVKGLQVAEPSGDQDACQVLKAAIQSYFRPSVNATAERHRFRKLRQKSDESVTSFMGRLREKAALCEFDSTAVDSVVNGQLRDQFIAGLQCQEARKQLLMESRLTLADAIAKAVALEASKVDNRLFSEEAGRTLDMPSGGVAAVAPDTAAVNMVKHRQHGRSKAHTCKYCGGTHPPGKDNCPAARVRCRHCSKVGHFEVACLSKSKEVRAQTIGEEDEADEICESVYTMHTDQKHWFTAALQVDGKSCEGLLDTGATRTILTSDIVQPTRRSDRTLRAYNGGVVSTLGMADVTLSSASRSCTVACFIVPKGSHRVLFGQDVIKELELLVPTHLVESGNVVSVAPVSITVKPDAVPVALPARRPPFSIKYEIETELQRLVDADIIKPVKEAAAWVSPTVPVRKPSGKLRLCIDHRQLNKNVVRERHVLPTLDEITAQLDGAQVFSVLDSESGFHQIELDQESRPLTTFAAHCGLYRFKRLPFGIASAPEMFQRVVSDILAGLPGVIVYIDDILVFGSSQEEHDRRLAAVRQRLEAANLRLNADKCQLSKSSVKYIGHWLSGTGVAPDGEKLQAIADMAMPKSLQDVQRFLGMVTYLGRFIPDMSSISEPVRRLAKRVPFIVDSEFCNAFSDAKRQLVQALDHLAYFRLDPNVPTAISCDASPCGLGAILWQQNSSGQWLPVTCASRTLTEVETRYSQMEREMLGVVFALQRFRQYVLGRHVEVHTDHQPPISIVQKPFDDVPPRLQRWLVSLMPYTYKLVHVPGKQLLCVDALSRAPLPGHAPSTAETKSMAEFVGMVLEACPVDLEQVAQATQDDSILHSILQRVLTSRWEAVSASEEAYLIVRDELSASEGVVLFNARVVIPEALRTAVMALAHEGHPGRAAFLESLRRRVWWPSVTKDATLYAERCSECYRKHSNSHQELLPSEIEGVWEKLAVDLVNVEGHQLLSIIDYGSRYPEVILLQSTSTTSVVSALMETFARFGLPAQLVSDNGPQFAGREMATFLQRLGIRHVKSSPRYARSNGMVERFHRLLKERMAGLKPHLPFSRRLQQVLFDVLVRPGCQVQPEVTLQERHLRQPSIPHPDRPPASMPQTRRQEEPKSTGHPVQPGPVHSEAGPTGVASGSTPAPDASPARPDDPPESQRANLGSRVAGGPAGGGAVFREGIVTRAGRSVQLSQKAKDAMGLV
ncbi:uncharacterized protein K02A2.6-like [Sycon ciliatum]|uniref:uncharacterized protein K02A2.6-like n=1 Tax=Sycon ciliatum TaxID=27933 RepID=UPI0031F6E9E2